MSELAALSATGTGRFRAEPEWFVVGHHGGMRCTRIGATAERAVDLLHALSVLLDPAVDVHINDVRTGRRWSGALLALPDVRDVLGRLRLPLASYGGVEVTLYTSEDQLSLTPELLLVIYARTDRWTFLLDGLGLVEREEMPLPTWWPARDGLRPVPPLDAALAGAAARLGLREEGP